MQSTVTIICFFNVKTPKLMKTVQIYVALRPSYAYTCNIICAGLVYEGHGACNKVARLHLPGAIGDFTPPFFLLNSPRVNTENNGRYRTECTSPGTRSRTHTFAYMHTQENNIKHIYMDSQKKYKK